MLTGLVVGTLGACAPSSPESVAEPPTLQRLIAEIEEHSLDAKVREAEGAYVDDATIAEDWSFDGGRLGGWRPHRTLARLRAETSHLRGQVVKLDRGLIVDVDLEASGLDYIWLRLSSERGGNGRLYWASPARKNFDEGRRVSFSVAAGGDQQLVPLPVGGHASWSGQITRLRLDLPPNSGEFAIDFIRIGAVQASSTGVLAQLRGRTGKAVVDDDARLSIFALPPHDVQWTVDAAPGSTLVFSYGILEAAASRPGNGTTFRVLLSDSTAEHKGDGAPHELFSDTLTPHVDDADRGWHEAAVDLPEGSATTARWQLTLRTEMADGKPRPSPFALAVWANPRVVRQPASADTATSMTGADQRGHPNIVLISLDALRADRVGAYGYPLATTPNLDRLATEAVVFEQATAQSPWSLPSYSSLFTSLYPSMIGVTEMSQTLPPDAGTLARLLRDSGYSTVAFTAGGFAGRHWGMDQGFERFWEGPSVDDLSERLERWAAAAPAQPFLLYLHSYELHDYFRAPKTHIEAAEALHGDLELPKSIYQELILDGGRRLNDRELDQISKLYDGSLRVMDDYLGRWLDRLRAEGLLDNTILVVFSDHGEAFGEHRRIVHHGGSVYDDLVQVPLVISYPAPPGQLNRGRIGTVVELIDVMPTVLELAGFGPPEAIQGRSLVPYLLRLGSEITDRGTRHAIGLSEQPLHGMVAFRRHGEKYIYTSAGDNCRPNFRRSPTDHFCEELFDLNHSAQLNTELLDAARLDSLRVDFLASYLAASPGIRLIARGGSETPETHATIRLTPDQPAIRTEGMYLESADRLEGQVTELTLAAGDLDLISWQLSAEARLGTTLSIELSTVDSSATPAPQIFVGPDCRRSATAGATAGAVRLAGLIGTGVKGPVTLPIASSEPTFCVVYTPTVVSRPGLSQPSEETVERLRALGYIDG